MFARLTRIVTTFTAILGAYLAYSFAAVPFIEPSVKEREAAILPFDNLPREPAADDAFLHPFLSRGEQASRIGQSRVFVTPNPSPANAVYSLDELVAWYRRLAAVRDALRRSRFNS